MLDDDIRIASDSPSRELRFQADTGESMAREFTRQKENGNIFLANRLGEELARPLVEKDKELFAAAERGYRSQLCFLYGFSVRRVVLDVVDVTILADTVLHRFQETVKDHSALLYNALNDSVSDTVYRLCLGSDGSVGSVFARLCGDEDDEALGNECYARYLDFSRGLVARFKGKFKR